MISLLMAGAVAAAAAAAAASGSVAAHNAAIAAQPLNNSSLNGLPAQSGQWVLDKSGHWVQAPNIIDVSTFLTFDFLASIIAAFLAIAIGYFIGRIYSKQIGSAIKYVELKIITLKNIAIAKIRGLFNVD